MYQTRLLATAICDDDDVICDDDNVTECFDGYQSLDGARLL